MALGLAKALVGYRNWWELRASFPQLISTCSTPCHDDDKQMLVILLLGAFLVLNVKEVKPDDSVQCLLQTKHLLALQVDRESDTVPVPKESGLERRQCKPHKHPHRLWSQVHQGSDHMLLLSHYDPGQLP